MIYHYPRAAQPALVDINLTIPVGGSVGLVGSTGADKTTLLDVILSLLRPTDGAITVDGEPVTDEHLRAWQAALGYVPQIIFLTDATVAENIVFGIDSDKIYTGQVERLSGGQRQRIGIARALYHDPDILVFDEATSTLDTVTERAVMEAIVALHHQKTFILIAHRLATVQGCDQVVLLEQGKVKAKGAFDALKDHSTRFRAMVVGR